MAQLGEGASHMLLVGPEGMIPVRGGQKNDVGHPRSDLIQHGHFSKTW